MKQNCPHFNPKKRRFTEQTQSESQSKRRIIIRNGSYFRRSDSKQVERFFCRTCQIYFSRATHSYAYRQKKRKLNPIIQKLIVSGVSQRRIAKILNINRKTVVRKFRHLALVAEQEHVLWMIKKTPYSNLHEVQFDDLETSEHSKCKPVSVAVAVEKTSRKILEFEVSQMPAKGRLARAALIKYGPRPDHRPQGWDQMLGRLSQIVHPMVTLTSDQNPHYPKWVQKNIPLATHIRVEGRDACVAGQGELKKGGNDPIFSLNHTCAMLRANMNRLFRRTWCTTKTLKGLRDHLWIYVRYHNLELTPPISAGWGGS